MNEPPAGADVVDFADTRTEAVGSIDLGRLGLRPFASLFVAGPLFVAVARLRLVPDGQPEFLPELTLGAIAAAATVLLPAALLRRWPDAARTHRLLLAGLVAAALAQLIQAVIWYWPLVPSALVDYRALIDVASPLVGICESVLLGLGLLRLCPGPRRTWLLGALVAAYVGLWLLWFAIDPVPGILDPFAFVVLVAGAGAGAFAAWVSVSAWIDRRQPRVFWALLAVGCPVSLGLQLLQMTTAFVIPLLPRTLCSCPSSRSSRSRTP